MSSILPGIYVSKLDIYRSGVARVYRGHDNHLGHDSSRPIVGSHGDSVQAIALSVPKGLALGLRKSTLVFLSVHPRREPRVQGKNSLRVPPGVLDRVVIGAPPPGSSSAWAFAFPSPLPWSPSLVVRYVFAVCHHRHNQGIRLCFAVAYAELPGCFAIRSPWRARARPRRTLCVC